MTRVWIIFYNTASGENGQKAGKTTVYAADSLNVLEIA